MMQVQKIPTDPWLPRLAENLAPLFFSFCIHPKSNDSLVPTELAPLKSCADILQKWFLEGVYSRKQQVEQVR